MSFNWGVKVNRSLGIPLISCIVLTGGKSIRLGRDKALEAFGTVNLVERVLSNLRLLKADLILVANTHQDFSILSRSHEFRVVFDIFPEKGPLGGIYTGISSSTTDYNLVVACDMPFLNVDLIRYMVEIRNDYDLVVPRKGKYYEPLHAIYSRNCLPVIDGMLKENELQVYQIIPLVKTRYVENSEIERFDPKHLSFFNINTEADLEKARKLTAI